MNEKTKEALRRSMGFVAKKKCNILTKFSDDAIEGEVLQHTNNYVFVVLENGIKIVVPWTQIMYIEVKE